MRGNCLSNLVFETYHDIIDAASELGANSSPSQKVITSTGMRDWAHIGQTPRFLVYPESSRIRESCCVAGDFGFVFRG